MKSGRIIILLFVVLALADRAAKQLALKLLPPEGGFLFKNIFGLQLLKNNKFVGLLSLPKTAFLAINFLFLLFLLCLLLKEMNGGKRKRVLALTIGLVGAGSNIADRLIYGQVIDFIVVGPWIINLSDIFILFGILFYIKLRNSGAEG